MLAAIKEAVMSDWFNNIDNDTINISDLAKGSPVNPWVQDYLLGWRDAVGNYFDHLPPDQAVLMLGGGGLFLGS